MIDYIKDFHYQWTAVASLCAFMIFIWLRPRFGKPAAWLFLSSAASAVYVWILVENRYLHVNPYDQMALRYFACDSIAKILLIAFPLIFLSDNRPKMRGIGEVLSLLFVMVSSCMAIWQARHGCDMNNCGGLIGNPSISMGMMVCMLPICLFSWRYQWIVIGLASIAVFLSQSSVAIGLLAAYAALKFLPGIFVKSKAKARNLALACILVLGIMGAGRLMAGRNFTSDSYRFKVWEFMFERWNLPANIPFGTGIGTYHVISINLQNAPKMEPVARGYWWNTLHNDFLQVLFECGAVGLLFFCLTYCSALTKVLIEGDYGVAISIVLYGLYMLMDPAFHNPLPILFGAWLFIYALRRPHTNKEFL